MGKVFTASKPRRRTMGIEYKGRGKESLRILNFSIKQGGTVASRLWRVENLISKITKLWRARKNMTGRVKSWRNVLSIQPNTKTNIHIHHSIFFFLLSTPLLPALTSYLPCGFEGRWSTISPIFSPESKRNFMDRHLYYWILSVLRGVVGIRGGIQEIGGRIKYNGNWSASLSLSFCRPRINCSGHGHIY